MSARVNASINEFVGIRGEGDEQMTEDQITAWDRG